MHEQDVADNARRWANLALRGTLFVIAIATVASPGAALPAYTPMPMPPSARSWEFEDAWVAPFVQYSQTRISGAPSCRVLWYSQALDVESKADHLRPYLSSFGFLFTSDPTRTRKDGPFDHWVFRGMYGDWQLELTDENVNVFASPNGRTLVRVLVDKRRNSTTTTAIVVYVMGRKTCSVGPLPGMQIASVRIGDDGGVATLLAPTGETGEPEAVIMNTRGDVTLRIPAAGVTTVVPGPNGRSALLWLSSGRVDYANAQGERRVLTPAIPCDPSFVRWVTGSMRVLLGNERQQIHALFDVNDGHLMWQAKAPKYQNPLYTVPFGGYVFQSGLEATPTPEEPDGSVRVLQALDIDTGEVRASWRSSPAERYTWEDIGKLMIRDERLYFVTDDAFSEISPGDIMSDCWQHGK